MVALDSKVRITMGCFYGEPVVDVNQLIEIGHHSIVVLNALSRYRSDDYNSDKYIDAYFKNKEKRIKKEN